MRIYILVYNEKLVKYAKVLGMAKPWKQGVSMVACMQGITKCLTYIPHPYTFLNASLMSHTCDQKNNSTVVHSK